MKNRFLVLLLFFSGFSSASKVWVYPLPEESAEASIYKVVKNEGFPRAILMRESITGENVHYYYSQYTSKKNSNEENIGNCLMSAALRNKQGYMVKYYCVFVTSDKFTKNDYELWVKRYYFNLPV